MFCHHFDVDYRLQTPEQINAARAEYRRLVHEIEADVDLVQRYEDEALERLDQQWFGCGAFDEWERDEVTVRALTRWGAERRQRRRTPDADALHYAGRRPFFALSRYRLAARRTARR